MFHWYRNGLKILIEKYMARHRVPANPQIVRKLGVSYGWLIHTCIHPAKLRPCKTTTDTMGLHGVTLLPVFHRRFTVKWLWEVANR